MNYLIRRTRIDSLTAQFLIVVLFTCSFSAIGQAQKLEMPSGADVSKEITAPDSAGVCSVSKFDLAGNSAGDGTDGNIRTFHAAGMSVRASAFGRRNSDGGWETAFLGAFSPGLGVTDKGEGNGNDGSHRVDNVGNRKNYVLFEFNTTVVIDKIYLDSVADDSDITVWFGNANNPFNNHLTLSDSLLTGFGPSEDNDTTSSSARSANVNSGLIAGNVLVVAASTSDTSPEDQFKIHYIDVRCPTPKAKVTIVKEVSPFPVGTASTQAFGFTSTNFGANNFSLVDNDVVGPDRLTNSNITQFGAANAITVTESQTPTWTLLEVVCTETGGIQNSTVDFALGKVNIIPESGETIVCTFRNGQLGPSAAKVPISGRVMTASGIGVSRAVLTLFNAGTGEVTTAITNPFGYYRMEAEVGSFFTLTVTHKRYTFADNDRAFTLEDELSGADFIQSF